MRALITYGLLPLLLWPLVLVTMATAANAEPIDVVVRRGFAVRRMSAYEIEAVFTRTQTRWSNGSPVIPINYNAGTSVRDQFDRAVLRLSPDEVGRFWLERRIRGMGQPPKQVGDPSLMIKVIENLPGSIGYVPTSRNTGTLQVVARVVQGRVVEL